MKTTDALKQIVDTTLEVIKDKVNDEATARSNADIALDNKINKLNSNDNVYWLWKQVDWVWVGHLGTFSINRQYIWDDGTDVYYSNGSTYQLRLKSETEWEDTTWNGVSSFYGSGVWKDLDGNIYLNYGGSDFKLNKETKTWESISLTNTPSPLNNMYIWDDGEYVYYSNGATQKKFNETEWVNVSWSGVINLDGNKVWKDTKGNIYYSNSSTQLIWDKSTLTWKSISGLASASGDKIWSDGNYTYLSNNAYLNDNTFNLSRWFNMNWLAEYDNSLSNISKTTVWKDFNNHIYYSPSGSSTYVTTPTILRDYLVNHAGRIDNPHKVTKAQVGLGNVTDDQQIKGLASGTTENDVVTFGADGYTVKDSGKSFTTSVRDSSNATDDKIPTEKAVRTELDLKVDKTTLGVISLSTSSGTLTLEQYAEISKDYAIIKYDDKTFYKVKLIQGEGGSNDVLVFLSLPENVNNTTYTSINLENIIVDTTTLAYAYSSDSIVDVYDTTQANNLFSTKANTVTNVSYDTTNDKFTLTINGTTSDIVSISTLKADIDALNDKYVRYDTNAQGLSSTQKSNAKTNIGLNNLTNDKQVKAIQSSTDEDIVVFNGTDGATIKDSGTKISDLQPKLDTQTAYTNKGSSTKVPQITTNSLGQVTNITEVTIDQPTVNDGTLTIQQDGITVGTFSANQSSNETVNIVSPTVNNSTISVERNQGKDNVTDTFTLNQSTNKTLNVDDLGARYNLSAFDSASGNTITRQMWQVDLGTLDYQLLGSAHNHYFLSNTSIQNIDTTSREAVCSIYTINNVSYDDMLNMQIRIETSGHITIRNDSYDASTTSGLNAFKGAMSGVILQYKLATPYTETIIENQPLITLDQKGSEWLRNEWEKGLNIWDEQWELGALNISNGSEVSSPDCIRNKGYIEVKPNTTYFIDNPSNLRILFYDASKTYIDYFDWHSSSDFITPNTTKYIRFYLEDAYGTTYQNNIMLTESDHAYPYHAYEGKIIHQKDLPTKTSDLTNDSGFITSSAIPSSLPADGGTSDYAKVLLGYDNRYVNETPGHYMTSSQTTVTTEFNTSSTIGYDNTGTYGVLTTFNPWTDSSGGYAYQLFSSSGLNKLLTRYGTDTSTWSSWKEIATTDMLSNYLPLTGGTMTGVLVTKENGDAILMRNASGYYSGINYRNAGNEAMCFENQNSLTSWIFRNINPGNSVSSWDTITPAMQIKNQRVTINKLIPNGANADYNLDVNGSINGTTLYENGTALSSLYLPLTGGSVTGATNIMSMSFSRGNEIDRTSSGDLWIGSRVATRVGIGYSGASHTCNFEVYGKTTLGNPNSNEVLDLVSNDSSGYVNINFLSNQTVTRWTMGRSGNTGNFYIGYYNGSSWNDNQFVLSQTSGIAYLNGNQIATTSDIPTNNNQLTNGAGYITGITSSDVTNALGYTPSSFKASDLLTYVYPVGSIYMSMVDTSPASFLGGTWARLTGRFLVGYGAVTDAVSAYKFFSAGNTDGEINHKLKESEMPIHTHKVYSNDSYSGDAIGLGNSNGKYMACHMGGSSGSYYTNTQYAQATQQALQSTGGDGSHNNLPPYLVVYMWKRTA